MTRPIIDPFQNLIAYPNSLRTSACQYTASCHIIPQFHSSPVGVSPLSLRRNCLNSYPRKYSPILHWLDHGSSSDLVSLDLSATVDTIDHLILLDRLEKFFYIHGLAVLVCVIPIWVKSVNSYRPFQVTHLYLHCRGTARFCPRTSAFISLHIPYHTYCFLFWPHTIIICWWYLALYRHILQLFLILHQSTWRRICSLLSHV